MKILGLLRHAKSDWDDMAKRDFDRGLNERGRKGARLIGDHVREHGVQWDMVLASTAERVRQTLASAFPDVEPEWDERLYLASCETILDSVMTHAGDAERVLVAGHNPGLQEVLFDLVDPKNENSLFDEAAAKFPTSAFAVFECDIDDWSELGKGCGRLVHFARPRDLDPALGPQT
ncbi:SixA phosphatase family protein [Altererythrobacter sp.]|uniref:SixA phosphatase family protein n=1 Tax=Altererythrobacter sp. TaxID=1872480 RepID=UPI003D086D4E